MNVDGQRLVEVARASVRDAFAGDSSGLVPGEQEPWWTQPAATFVTITEDGQLRGCIGSVTATRSLAEDLHANARAAAFRDPRFTPMRESELEGVRFEVSLLGPLEPMRFVDEADALRQLRPGRDGVVLSWRGHRGLFLPQVWDQLPEPRQFLAQLKRKAGLPMDFWAPDLTLERFEVHKWKEAAP